MELFLPSSQVSEMILNNKELEFYKWDGDLSKLLNNVREKLNKVAEVAIFCLPEKCSVKLIKISAQLVL